MIKINPAMSVSKILKSLSLIRQDIKIKNTFCRYCLQWLSSERVLVEHKEIA